MERKNLTILLSNNSFLEGSIQQIFYMGFMLKNKILALHFVNYIVIIAYIKYVMIIILSWNSKYGKNEICQIFKQD